MLWHVVSGTRFVLNAEFPRRNSAARHASEFVDIMRPTCEERQQHDPGHACEDRQSLQTLSETVQKLFTL